MNVFFVNESKKLSLKADGKIYYNYADTTGENDFAHCKVIVASTILDNIIGDDDSQEFTAVLRCYTTTVDSDSTSENDIDLTLTYDEDKDVFVSDEFTLGEEIICGVGRVDVFVEFTGTASELGMTNSEKIKIYDVLTNDSEYVYPAPGFDETKLDSIIQTQAEINERLSELYG